MDVKAFIQSIGKAPFVAEWLGRKVSTVYGWYEKGEIPPKWCPQLAALAKERGVPVPPEVAAFAGSESTT